METPAQNIEADFSGLDAVQQRVQGQTNLSEAEVQQIRSTATPGIRLAAVRNLHSAHEAKDADSVLALIETSKVLGMEENPYGDKIIKALSAFYEPKAERTEETAPEPAETTTSKPKGLTRRNLLKRAGKTALGVLALEAATAAGSILQSSEETQTLEPTPTIVPEPKKEQLTTFDEFIKPLVEETRLRRKSRAAADPEYYHRIDKELNEDRINFLLLVTGTHLRPGLDPILHSASQIVSFDLKTKSLSFISITGDMRNPKAERYLKSHNGNDDFLGLYGIRTELVSINSSLDVGSKYGGQDEGNKLLRESFEDASGLSMDFQGTGTDGAVKDLVDNVLVSRTFPSAEGGIDFEVPLYLPLFDVDIDGIVYPAQEFKPGKRHFDGKDLVQYVKGQDTDKEGGGTWREGGMPHQRLHTFLEALPGAVTSNLLLIPLVAGRFVSFLKRQLDEGKFTLDFDIGNALNFDVLKSIIGRSFGFDIKKGKSIFIAASEWGGDGARLMGKESPDPDLWWMEIPENGDPNAKDLVTGYWQSIRNIVKQQLMG